LVGKTEQRATSGSGAAETTKPVQSHPAESNPPLPGNRMSPPTTQNGLILTLVV